MEAKVREFIYKIAQLGDMVTLLHGSDLKSCNSMMEKGISSKMLSRLSGGAESFWMLGEKDMASAEMFGQANPRGAEDWGVVKFTLPRAQLQSAIQSGQVTLDPNWDGMEVYEFKPSAFGLLNAASKSLVTRSPASVGAEEGLEQTAGRATEMKDVQIKVSCVTQEPLEKAAKAAYEAPCGEQQMSDAIAGIDILRLSDSVYTVKLAFRDEIPSWKIFLVVFAGRLRAALPGAESEIQPIR